MTEEKPLDANRIRIADLDFPIASAGITGFLDIRHMDGRANLPASPHVKICWSIEVRGEEKEAEEGGWSLEPVFMDQSLPVMLMDWRDLAGTDIAFDAEKDGDLESRPSLYIGGGDTLPVSLIRIGARNGVGFALEWTGTCYPGIDETRSGIQPFAISGMLVFRGLTVVFHDEGGDWPEQSAQALARHIGLSGLRAVSARKPYEGLEGGAGRTVHVRFEPEDEA